MLINELVLCKFVHGLKFMKSSDGPQPVCEVKVIINGKLYQTLRQLNKGRNI